MAKVSIFFILFVICIRYTAAAVYDVPLDSLLHKTFAQRAPLTSSLYQELVSQEDSSQWFARVNAIKKIAIANNDHDLIIEAQILQTYYNIHRYGQNTPLCMGSLDDLYKLALHEKNDVLLARVEHLQGNYCWGSLVNYEMALEHFLAEYEVMKVLTDEEYPDKQPSYYKLGECYYFFSDYREAIFFMKKSLQLTTPLWNYYEIQATNTIGLCYRELNMLDSADYYFNKVRKLAVTCKNEAWQGIADGNLGQNHFLRANYGAAIPLLQQDVALSIKRSDWGCAAGAQATLANIFLKKNDLANAAKLIQQSYKWAVQSGQYQRLAAAFPIISKVYALQGNPVQATLYMDSAFAVKDSLARKFSALQLLRARQKNDLQNHRAQLAQIEDQKQIKTLQRNALLAALVVLMLVALYIYTLQRNRHIQKQQLFNMQLKEKEKQLEMARMQLSDFARNISEKSRLLEELQMQIEGTNNHALIAQLQQKTILTEEEWEHFRNLFEQVHTGFIQRMKLKMPGLTPAEIRFMVLVKLQFSTKEMAAILGVSANAIHNIWYRLRKKLSLPEDGSIEELVAAI